MAYGQESTNSAWKNSSSYDVLSQNSSSEELDLPSSSISVSGADSSTIMVGDSSNDQEILGEVVGVSNVEASTMADARISYSVGNIVDLTLALTLPTVDTINLTSDLDLGILGFAVTRDITINGDKNDGMGGRYTITYGNPLGTNNSTTRGIYYGASNITITYKNVNFGFESALGSNNKTNASNYYGIAPPGILTSGKKLVLENVGYYSDYGAEPLFLNGANETITFKGTNTFIMKGGTDSEEFAECANFIFEAGSTTTVTDSNTDQTGFIYAANGSLNMQIGAGASFNVTSNHDFLYTSGANPTISIGDGGSLNYIKTTAKSTGKFISQTDKNLTVGLGIGSKFDIQTQSVNQFANLTINQARDSEVVINSAVGDALNASTMATFNIDNASRLTLQGTTNSVVGNNAKFNFSTYSNGRQVMMFLLMHHLIHF
ncbi:hypothetical protein OZX60_06810 [Streptococcaceae bacterium ESL0687]|nr:hypothetical protein OZX60_06810 [Streptococcaceae bacterium ESL0687]